MARQNIYDDPTFFAGYDEFREMGTGLHEKILLPHLPSLLPSLVERRVVDLGCGDGWFCRYARSLGAANVVGIEPSERMLERAQEKTSDPGITFVHSFAEDAQLPAGSADVVVSILALHYVEDLAGVLTSIASWLTDGGIFVAVVEHPVVTSQLPKTGFATEADGSSSFWPVHHYFDEGERQENWHVEGVTKYHRRLETQLAEILKAGFQLEAVTEPSPSDDVLQEFPDSINERIRPAVLGWRAVKPRA